MIVDWIQEAASLWLLMSIVYAMNLHNGRETTKKGTGSAVGTTRNPMTEKTELEKYASDAPW